MWVVLVRVMAAWAVEVLRGEVLVMGIGGVRIMVAWAVEVLQGEVWSKVKS